MNILEKIVKHKQREVMESKDLHSVKLLERSLFFESPTVSLKSYLKRKDRVGVIAEIKRSSPSTGLIGYNIDVEELSIDYMQSGASALSVLTDNKFFRGSNSDLEIARKYNYCPILRKDFIIDEYQIVEAKSIGADCILLIAACISSKQCKKLAAFAKTLKLEVLLEVHSKEEIESHVNAYIDIVGVNNRDLQRFTTTIEVSKTLSKHLPNELVKISESGISEPDQIRELKEYGYDGFLIGGHFMQNEDPGQACKLLIDQCKTLTI